MGLKNMEVLGPYQGWELEGLGVVMVLQRLSWWWVMERLVGMQCWMERTEKVRLCISVEVDGVDGGYVGAVLMLVGVGLGHGRDG